MPRKPNYNFERQERERVKAAKKAEREKVKAERRAANKAANDSGGATDKEGETPKDESHGP